MLVPDIPASPVSHRLPRVFRSLPPPIIVIGMHRSGTSLVAGMLSLQGVAMGDCALVPPTHHDLPIITNEQRVTGYCESAAFYQVNDEILMACGANWDSIEPFLTARSKPKVQSAILCRMMLAAHGTLARSVKAATRPGQPWGWKDPRTTLTLGFWLKLFPEAKVIHVRRDTEGIINSLVRRETASVAGLTELGPQPKWIRFKRLFSDPYYRAHAACRALGLRPRELRRHAPDDRAAWGSLAQVYVGEALRYASLGERYLEIGYEEILQDPYASASLLAEFAGGAPSKADLQRSASFVAR